MFNTINFKGHVYLTGSTKNLSPKNEISEMKTYADKNNCDVVVINRDYYNGNKGKYTTILVKENNTTGQNQIEKRIFDFQYPQKSKSSKWTI